uniref:Zinc finger PMZ-type domain-containing protein n=1 Tax=Tanacetum cinerariifolium TaxID=118510 RepID=A0A699H0B6_TANCI|nr:hypothetical protein CTI12_AA176900 [Tanacetum cinerariifolium]
MSKRVPEKNHCITVNLHHDGVFTVSSFEYEFGDENQITDIYFKGMSYVQFRKVIVKLVHGLVVTLYYCKVDHSGYDALDIRDQEETIANDGNESSDAYFFSDEDDLSYFDFYTKVNDNVIIKNVTTNDPFLNQLCPNRAHFLNVLIEPVFANDEIVVEDSENIDPKFNVKDVEAGRCARKKFLINVSLRRYKRAKQRALFDYERGLKEHYGRLWKYRQAILDSNPGSTCKLDDEETKSGHYYFRRIYVCFKGVKEGWLAGCRKVIGLDGCFLKHTCRGELLVAMGRDENNQMYPIAWAVVKRLLEGVTELLPNAEHRKCTRHLFANFKKKFSGVQLQCLFWNVPSTTVEQLYILKMEKLKRLVEMNKVARNWDHTITPSIRKRLELLKIAQRMWQLSGIPCVHSVAAYNHMNRDPIEGVDHCYSQQKWFEAYQFSIKPVFRTTMWKKTNNPPPPLPPILRTMPGRPRKNMMKAQSENNLQVSKLGRKMTCTNCKETVHNKSSCKKEPVPKPPKVPKLRAPRTVYGTHAPARVRGRGSRGGRGAFGGRGEGSENIGESSIIRMSQRGRGRGQRGRGSGERGRGRGEKSKGRIQRGRGRDMYLKDHEEMTEDEVRKNLKHDYMEELLEQDEWMAMMMVSSSLTQEAHPSFLLTQKTHKKTRRL